MMAGSLRLTSLLSVWAFVTDAISDMVSAPIILWFMCICNCELLVFMSLCKDTQIIDVVVRLDLHLS